MISIDLENKELKISFKVTGNALFSKLVSIFKKQHFRFNPENKCWYGAAYKYDDIVSKLEDLDEIHSSVSSDDLTEIIAGKPEQIIEKQRRIPDYSLMNYPPMIGKHPYEKFQAEGISKGINRSRYAYFWEMGTGKSYVAAAIIAHRLYKYHDAKKVLFLTTSIGVRNLKYELKKFIKDLDDSRILIGDKNCRNVFDYDADIIIASYNSFRLICDFYKKKKKIKSTKPRNPFLPLTEWFDGGDGILILDESHEIMNVNSQRGYLVNIHSSLFKYRYLFSGTPADQPEKLYNQEYVLDPWLVYNLSFSQWKEKMAYLGNFFSASAIREWKKDELEKANKRFLKSHGNYYATKDVVELPEYYEKKIYLEMKPYHRQLYERIVVDDLNRNIRGNKTTVRDFVNRFPYLMLAVDNPDLLRKHEEKFDEDLNELINGFKPDYMEKLDALEDIVSDHPGDKILVWAIHPLTINEIANRFKKLNPICITGNTKQEERNDLVEKFKKEKDCKMLVANIQTLNTSTTITEAKVQVYVERGFSYSPYEQSTRRIYRIGQKDRVETYILLYDRSINILQDKNLSSKGKLVSGLVSKEFLSQKDWQTIFNCKSSDNLVDKFGK